jgi:two-component system OmpR family response regulator
MSPLCLILSADAGTAAELSRDFSKSGLKPYVVDSLPHAASFMRQWRVDGMVVDAEALREFWPEAIAELRVGSAAPLLMLSTSSEDSHQIAALRSGATAVAVKPISGRLLAQQLRSLLCCQKQADPAPARAEINIGSLRLDPRRIRVSFRDVPLSVTSAEFELLFLLASRLDDFVHRAVISAALQNLTGTGRTSRSADMHVCRLRRKLESAGVTCARIETIYGRGYSLHSVKEPKEGSRVFRQMRYSV